MEGTTAEPPAELVFLARPNCSLSPAARRTLLYVFGLVVFGIAIGFAWLGAWPILPFAGAEIGVLVWAIKQCDRHAQDYEKIVIASDALRIEWRDADKTYHCNLSRYWARVEMAQASPHECQVSVCSHGRQVKVGRHLDDQARRTLAKELRNHLGQFGLNHQRGQ